MTSDNSSGDSLLRLADEFAERYRRGERPPLSEYTDKYPQLASQIRDMFPAMVMMEEFGSVAAPPTGPYGGRTDFKSVPQQLGEYRILREVARGGMGIVYEAVQESLGRHVALKVLPAHALMSPTHLERFRREARAAAGLHHTNIVPVFGVGEDQGVHYYAMQFIQGQGLDSVLHELRRQRRSAGPGTEAPEDTSAQNGHECHLELSASLAGGLLTGQFPGKPVSPLSPDPSPQGPAEIADCRLPIADCKSAIGHRTSEISTTLPGHGDLHARSDSQFFRSVAQVGVQVAEALAYAHQQGVLHRDIKPSNLLLDLQGIVWITDFGLAKSEGTDELTTPGDIVGTLRYMAPERFEGRADARSEVFSLGLTLYEMVTLQPAFTASQRPQLIEKMLHEEPPRPRKVDSHVPRDLETIILKAIAKEPERRYPTAAALAEDLHRFLADRPVLARRSSWREQTWRWCRRNPAVAALLGLVVFVLVAGIVVSTAFALQTRQQAKEADKSAREANDNATEANTQKTIALENEKTANANELLARHRLYAAQMNLAMQAWETANPARVLELLEGQRPKFDQQDLRSFEWYYLWRLCYAERRLCLHGHTGPVTSVAFSPDGKTVASASHDDTVRLWDPITGHERSTLKAKQSSRFTEVAFTAVAFAPDGKTLAGADWNGMVQLWDAATGQQRATLEGKEGSIRCLAISPDGKTLATAAKAVKLLDLATLREQATLRGEGFLTVAFAPDGKTVAAGSGESVKWWTRDGGGWQEKAALQGHGFGPPVAFSPDGKVLAAGGPVLKLYDADTGKTRATFQGHRRHHVVAITFSPDGNTLATGSEDRTVRLWEVATGKERTLGAHLNAVYSVAFSPDGKVLASGSADGTVSLWATASGREGSVLQHSGGVHALAFTPDGKTLVSGGAYPTQLWDVITEKAAPLKGHTEHTGGFALSPAGKNLAVPGPEKTVKLWDLSTGQARATFRAQTEVSGAAYSADGKTLATWKSWMGDPTVKLWDVGTQQLRATLQGQGLGSILSVVFSPDGKTLVAGAQFNSFKVWDVATGQEKIVIRLDKGHSSTWSVAFSPDGKTLATGDSHGTVRLWNVDRWQLQASLKGHTDVIRAMAFSPDGKTLATASIDSTVRLWDVATGQERVTLKGHTGDVSCLAFAPDGKTLATGSADGTVRLWRAATNPESTAPKTELDPDDPDSPLAQNDGAVRLWRSGKPAEAEKAYRGALTRLEKLAAVFPNVSGYRKELARCGFSLSLLLSITGGPQNAAEARRQGMEHYQKLSAEYQRSVTREYNVLGDLLQAAGSHQEAEQAYSLAIELNPTDWAVWFGRAYTYAATGQHEKALADYTKLIELDPNNAEAWNNRGVCYESLGQQDKAIENFSKAVELKPADALPWHNRGRIHARLGKWDKAVTDFSKAIELNAAAANYWTARATAYLNLQKYDKAIADFSKAIELKPDYAEAWNDRGAAQGRLKQIEKAIADYSEAIRLKPDFALALHNRASMYAAQGQWDKAIADFAKVVELVPTNAVEHNNLAWFLVTCPDPKFREPAKAVKLAKKAVDMAPKEGNHWNTLGVANYRAGEWKAAIEALEKSKELLGDTELSFNAFFLAMAHWKLDQKQEAHKWYDQAVAWMEKNKPQDEELKRFRAEAEDVLKIEKKVMPK